MADEGEAVAHWRVELALRVGDEESVEHVIEAEEPELAGVVACAHDPSARGDVAGGDVVVVQRVAQHVEEPVLAALVEVVQVAELVLEDGDVDARLRAGVGEDAALLGEVALVVLRHRLVEHARGQVDGLLVVRVGGGQEADPLVHQVEEPGVLLVLQEGEQDGHAVVVQVDGEPARQELRVEAVRGEGERRRHNGEVELVEGAVEDLRDRAQDQRGGGEHLQARKVQVQYVEHLLEVRTCNR